MYGGDNLRTNYMDHVQTILLATLVGLLVILAVFYVQGSARTAAATSPLHRPTFLVVGAVGAGKTALFHRLTTGAARLAPTVLSLEPSVLHVAVPFSNAAIQKTYQIIDYPGHLKYRQLLRKLVEEDIGVAQLKGVVYVVDSLSAALLREERVAAMAQELFTLLSVTEKTPNGVDFLFAVNKQDLFDLRPVHKVKLALEQELAKLVAAEVAAKGAALASGIDADDVRTDESTRDFWRAAVGLRAFRFELLEGNMDFVGGLVAKNISGWENWFDERAVNYGGI